MKKLTKDQTIYLLGGVIVVLVIAIIATVILLQPQNSFKLKNDSETNQSETNNNKDLPASSEGQESASNGNHNETVPTPTPDTPSATTEPTPDSSQETTETPTNPQTPTPTPSTPSTPSQPPTTNYTENDVIEYFQSASNTLDQQNDQNNSSFVDKAKNAFTTVVDFIFYGKEINGYTFSELTTSAKMKVIEIALKIDAKINQYFPNYKESIKAGYENIKGKLAYAYLEITSSLCEAVGTDTCEQAKEDFNNMKKSFSFTFDLIKELAKSGASKVKEFYENTFKN